MRAAYALLGVLWVIVIAGAWWGFNRGFTKSPDTAIVTSTTTSSMSFTIMSSVFEAGGMIPSRYTCDDKRDLNPPLSISGTPTGTQSLALIMDDPDVPKALKPDGMFVHWVLFNIPPNTTGIAEGASAGIAGANGAGQNAYTGPCPPKEYEPSTHRYFFKLYALDTELSLSAGATKSDVEHAMQGHIIAEAQYMGRYKKQ